MTRLKPLSPLFADSPCALDSPAQKLLYYLWNAGMFLLSSLGISVLSLLLAIGTYDYNLFYYYMSTPLVFILNTLPVLLFQFLLFCVFGRQWPAFLGTALLFLAATVGDFYKLKFRCEPFTFSDLSAIGAAFKVASEYNLEIGNRIALVIFYILSGTPCMAFLARGKMSPRPRLLGAAFVLISVFPLWHFVYSNDELYRRDLPDESLLVVNWGWDESYFTARGFVYPFLYSIKSSLATPPGRI